MSDVRIFAKIHDVLPCKRSNTLYEVSLETSDQPRFVLEPYEPLGTKYAARFIGDGGKEVIVLSLEAAGVFKKSGALVAE